MLSHTLQELSQHTNTKVKGDNFCVIERVNNLQKAKQGDISFLADRRLAKYLPDTKASAVIIKDTDISDCPTNALLSDFPYLTYIKVVSLLYPANKIEKGVHPSAVIDDSATIDPSAYVSAHVTISKNVKIGQSVFIGSGCVIESGVEIGDNSYLFPNVTIYHDIRIGHDVIIHSGAVIGSDGFGYVPSEEGHIKIPHVGSIKIGNQVEIGANCTIDRGVIDDAIIGDGVKIDNQVHIGHNVCIGEHTMICGCVGISGSVNIGKRCMIAGGVGIAGHIDIADDVTIAGMSSVSHSLKKGIYGSANLVTDFVTWRKNAIIHKKLYEILKTYKK